MTHGTLPFDNLGETVRKFYGLSPYIPNRIPKRIEKRPFDEVIHFCRRTAGAYAGIEAWF
jgi:hypothetical protein